MKTLLSIVASFALATAAFGGSCGSCCPDGGKKDGKKEASVVQLGSNCGGCKGDKKDGKKEASVIQLGSGCGGCEGGKPDGKKKA